MSNIDLTEIQERAEGVLSPLARWDARCHAASLELVRAGIGGRVARGSCEGVVAQHSWVVLGEDCYDDEAVIVDPTLWSYDIDIEGVWVGSYRDGRHRPFGKGSIWKWGRPGKPTGLPITLTPSEPLSVGARIFLEMLGPLDYEGWRVLAHAPVEDWPAAEILSAIVDTPELRAIVPIDIIGMLTDRNPQGLYLASSEFTR